jgi:hypothetical protein
MAALGGGFQVVGNLQEISKDDETDDRDGDVSQ